MVTSIRQSELPTVAALAFLGDAVYTLYVRRRAVASGIPKSGALSEESNRHVKAAAQARALEKIRPLFTPLEEDVCRRAGNSTHLNRPKSASGADYRSATGLEAVLGMLYHTGDAQRLDFLLSSITDE